MPPKRKPENDLKEILEKLLIQALRNPLSPEAACSIAIGQCARTLIDLCKPHPHLAPAMQNVARAAMHFLTLYRTAAEFGQMRQKLGQCNCNLRDSMIKAMHKSDTGKPMEPCHIFYFITQLVIAPLQNLKPGHFQKSKNPVVKLWPSDLEDLLQGSKTCDQLVKNLFKWTDFSLFDHSSVIRLFARLAVFSRYFEQELSRSEEWFEKALDLLNLIRDTSSEWKQNLEEVDYFRLKVLRPLQDATAFFDAVCYFANNEQRVHVSISNPIALPRFRHLSFEIKSFLESDDLRGAISSQAISELHSSWKNINRVIATFTGASEAPRMLNIPPGAEEFRLALDHLFYSLTMMRSRDRCMNPKCHSLNDVKSERTKMCNGCQTIRYCSPKCQKEAWSSEPLPHKVLCKELRTFQEELTTEEHTWSNLVVLPPDRWEKKIAEHPSFLLFQAICEKKELLSRDSLALLAIHVDQLRDVCSPDTEYIIGGPGKDYVQASQLKRISHDPPIWAIFYDPHLASFLSLPPDGHGPKFVYFV